MLIKQSEGLGLSYCLLHPIPPCPHVHWYCSIGWSVGATLGLAVAGRHEGRRVLACIGDGSFQMTAQVGLMAPGLVCLGQRLAAQLHMA